MTLTLDEYSRRDGLGLAELVTLREVTPRELALAALESVEALDPLLHAVVEVYEDRVTGLDEARLGSGPFRGVPFLIKDTVGHERGRLIESGSRLAKGLVSDQSTHLAVLLRQAGLNVIGRSAVPEFSSMGTTEGALHGNTSNPWREGFSPGGSTGGGQAAVTSGMVPLAHGTDIAGSIRLPAAHCGGVGFKPSRGRISAGPAADELGWGFTANFVQTRSVRDAAAMLDCLAVPQPGDPFTIPRPAGTYASIAKTEPKRLRIGFSVDPLMGVSVDPEVAQAVRAVSELLAAAGHEIVEKDPRRLAADLPARLIDLWYFGFDSRIERLAALTGRSIDHRSLEPSTLVLYEHARALRAADFLAAQAAVNMARRSLATYFDDIDVWISPTAAAVAEPWGTLRPSGDGLVLDDILERMVAVPYQFTLPHNIIGGPAVSLPLAVSADGLPIGIQLAAPPAGEHDLLPLCSWLETALPWSHRRPPLHVSSM